MAVKLFDKQFMIYIYIKFTSSMASSKTFLFLVLLASTHAQNLTSQIEGQLTIPLATMCEDISTTPDGQMFVCNEFSRNIISIFQNTGNGYAREQEIPVLLSPIKLKITSDGQKIYLVCEGGFLIFQKNTTYHQILEYNYTQTGTVDFAISDDESVLAITFSNSKLILHKKTGLAYAIHQTILDATDYLKDVTISEDNARIIASSRDLNVRVYQFDGLLYQLNQTINPGFYTHQIALSQDSLALVGLSPDIFCYSHNGTEFVLAQSIAATSATIKELTMLGNLEKFVFGGPTGTVTILTKENSTYTSKELYLSGAIKQALIDRDELYYIVSTYLNNIEILYRCPPECTHCHFPNNCSACLPGYALQNGKCLTDSDGANHCVQGRFIKDNICQEYCHRKCRSCNLTRTDCIECADFYIKDSSGECVVENQALSLLGRIRPLLNFVKRRGAKAMFLAVDDLWLYNYHSHKYDGTALTIFETIQFIEEQQWEIVGLDKAKETLETSIEQVPLYNPQSNPTYMEKERKNNMFIASTMDYFAFYIPLILIVVFLFNKIFYCLFDHEVSILFRPYSFWWIIFELLFQGNVEFFTFLAFRNCLTPYSFDAPSQLLQVLMVLMFFLTVVASFCSYFWYFREYREKAKYFLVNMFRFPSSYGLMIVVYGAKPFLKGSIHALMYAHWQTQVWMLFGTELLILIVVFLFEFNFDNHRSKPVFMMNSLYNSSLLCLNLLFLLKYRYFKGDTLVEEKLEELITTIVFFMVGVLCLKLVWETFPWKNCKKQFSSEDGDEDSEKKEGKGKDKKRQVCNAQVITLDELLEEVKAQEVEEQRKRQEKKKNQRKGNKKSKKNEKKKNNQKQEKEKKMKVEKNKKMTREEKEDQQKKKNQTGRNKKQKK